MIRPQRFPVWPALGGTLFLVGWAAGWLFGLGLPGLEITHAASITHTRATSVAVGAERAKELPLMAVGKHTVSIADVAIVEAALADVSPTPLSATPLAQVVLSSTSDPVPNDTKGAVNSVSDECLGAETCIDQYLWSLYERTPKVDTQKVVERVKVAVKKKGKTRTVIKSVTKLVNEDFTWKDPKVAQRAGMSLKEYVIGGMDRSFKLRLYHALRALDETGLSPGITSGFRDDYRQSIVSGDKAATDSSYHGGSRRGGYGYEVAADLVSVRGETRSARWRSSVELWKWIDAHGKDFGIGRPYLDKDPPHVAPIDGKEYAAKRGAATAKLAGLAANKRPQSAVRDNHGMAKRAPKAKSLKVGSI